MDLSDEALKRAAELLGEGLAIMTRTEREKWRDRVRRFEKIYLTHSTRRALIRGLSEMEHRFHTEGEG